MKKHYFNIKEHDITCIQNLSQHYTGNFSICVLYPNYNLTYDDFVVLHNNINKKVDWNITLVENKYFELKNDYNIAKIECYNNIDLDKITIINNTFDLIVMSRIVEHLTPEQYMYLLYNLKNIINKNSRIAITYPDMDVISRLFRNYKNKKNKMRIEDYILWNIEFFNPYGENNFDYHKMYTNPYIVKSLSEYESLFVVDETTDLFAINSNRSCYRTTVLKPEIND